MELAPVEKFPSLSLGVQDAYFKLSLPDGTTQLPRTLKDHVQAKGSAILKKLQTMDPITFKALTGKEFSSREAEQLNLNSVKALKAAKEANESQVVTAQGEDHMAEMMRLLGH
uniref:Uncharacterized protein n=1 Tax=Strombidium inclinatum TaxID=197538 RepID=A0A7S3MUU3_9SPIT|mmetsp:Transcript_15229/g.23512  ORF Transcript_15229/g.23512 Transcript_15229/m.23512 type:complete len:113 (+) Transcript_15229:956-1294(+)